MKQENSTETQTKIETGKNMELQKSQHNAQEQENNLKHGKMIERIKVPYTPFEIVKIGTDEEKNCFIAVGNKRITEVISQEVAEKKIRFRDWDIIVSIITIVAEQMIENNNSEQIEKETINQKLGKLKEQYKKQ